MSFAEIRSAKLRSFLSLLGISIGIICIISVYTAVDSLEMNIQNSMASLFNNGALYISKFSWMQSEEEPWWKLMNRPGSNRRELEQLQRKTASADAMCMISFIGGLDILANDQIAEGAMISGVTYDYDKIKEIDFTEGRYFTPAECSSGQRVALIGAGIAESLFQGKGQIEGRQIKINGVKLIVVGLMKKEGSDMFGFSLDQNVIVPYPCLAKIINRSSEDDPWLAVVPKKNKSIEELKTELRGAMRSIRRLSPYQNDNFAINQISVFAQSIKNLFSIVNAAGLFIGGFSMLVGTFGIANIMFVSVQERVYQIGIKKALGAKKIYILLEFLLESVILCVLGGVMGLITVILLFKLLGWLVAQAGSDFKFYITYSNIMIGISISIVTGILAGFLPALSAANMRPVDAIRGEVSDLFKGFTGLFRARVKHKGL